MYLDQASCFVPNKHEKVHKLEVTALRKWRSVPFFDALLDYRSFIPTLDFYLTTVPEHRYVRPEATPIWRLLVDPHVACCAGALVVANVSLAFLEPTISKWMNDTMDAEEWQQVIGVVWVLVVVVVKLLFLAVLRPSIVSKWF